MSIKISVTPYLSDLDWENSFLRVVDFGYLTDYLIPARLDTDAPNIEQGMWLVLMVNQYRRTD